MGKRSAEYAMETDVGFFLIQAVGKYSALASGSGRSQPRKSAERVISWKLQPIKCIFSGKIVNKMDHFWKIHSQYNGAFLGKYSQ